MGCFLFAVDDCLLTSEEDIVLFYPREEDCVVILNLPIMVITKSIHLFIFTTKSRRLQKILFFCIFALTRKVDVTTGDRRPSPVAAGEGNRSRVGRRPYVGRGDLQQVGGVLDGVGVVF
jgi:hypothetical protein